MSSKLAGVSHASSPVAARILEARGVTVRFEGVTALDSVDLELGQGEILGLIGPNGAGKTTMVNVLTGFQKPSAGSVWIDGRNVTRRSPQNRVRRGVCRSFQSTRLFGGLSVAENIELGGLSVGLKRKEARRQSDELLAQIDLQAIAQMPAIALPHGEQRRVGILRALASRPVFLLLDEPAAGLTEDETDRLVTFIKESRDRLGCGVLAIEHDMRMIMGLCERIHVLDFGRTIAVGSPEATRTDPAVIAAYLGEEEAV